MGASEPLHCLVSECDLNLEMLVGRETMYGPELQGLYYLGSDGVTVPR